MATPEEQKATLHANRRARPGLPTSGPSPTTTSTRPHDRRSTLQSSQLRALALAASLALAPSPSSQSSSSYTQTPQQDETSQWDTSSQDDSAQQAQAQQAQRLAGLQAAMSLQGKQQAQN
ncbi:MAG: hypothetical protein NUV84_01765, partial [Candidatus Uhrbacteria bacterium]|nr:hypothetical protein [Candidatus Uhrbacteria bacterium]